MEKNKTAYDLVALNLQRIEKEMREVLSNQIYEFFGEGTVWDGQRYRFKKSEVDGKKSKILFYFDILGTEDEELFYLDELKNLRPLKPSQLEEKVKKK